MELDGYRVRKPGQGGNSASSLIVIAAVVLLLSYIVCFPQYILGVVVA